MVKLDTGCQLLQSCHLFCILHISSFFYITCLIKAVNHRIMFTLYYTFMWLIFQISMEWVLFIKITSGNVGVYLIQLKLSQFHSEFPLTHCLNLCSVEVKASAWHHRDPVFWKITRWIWTNTSLNWIYLTGKREEEVPGMPSWALVI